MTREEILAMEPGSALNTLIAERVMNWYVSEGEYSGKKYWNDENDYSPYAVADFKPSTDISAAWEVVEKMKGIRMNIEITPSGSVACIIGHVADGTEVYDFQCQFAPEAICKAALLAVMTEEVAHERSEASSASAART